MLLEKHCWGKQLLNIEKIQTDFIIDMYHFIANRLIFDQFSDL